MNIRPNAAPICLHKDQAVLFSDARGAAIRCVHGLLWITQDGHRRDIVLEAGQSHVVDDDSRAIVFALRASSVDVTGLRQRAASGWGAAAIDRLRAAWGRRPGRAPQPALAH